MQTAEEKLLSWNSFKYVEEAVWLFNEFTGTLF